MLNKYLFLLMIFSGSMLAQIGQVVALKGDVELLRNSLKSNLALKDKILAKDYIITLDNSKTQILLKDETIITIGENSEFDIQDYLFENKINSTTNFNFLKGTFRIITGQIGKISPKNFNLETKSSSIGIRGTEIFLELEPEKEKIICTEGSIKIRIKKTDEVIILNVGEFLVVDLKTNKLKVEKIAKLAQVPSFSNAKIDKKYDEWIKELKSQELNSIDYAVSDAFSKQQTTTYEATKLNGTINEKTDGLESFDLTNSSFDLSIDFGKARDDNPVTGKIKIKTTTNTSLTNGLTGNIDESNKINLSYKVKKVSGSDYIRENASGNLEFKDNALNIQGSDLTLSSHAQNEEIIINEVEFKSTK